MERWTINLENARKFLKGEYSENRYLIEPRGHQKKTRDLFEWDLSSIKRTYHCNSIFKDTNIEEIPGNFLKKFEEITSDPKK